MEQNKVADSGAESYHRCEYFLIRVAPDPIRNEYLNIGVGLYEPDGDFADVRLIHDFKRVRCIFPGFQPEDIQTLQEDLRQRLRGPRDGVLSRQYWLHWAEDSFSHGLQITVPNGVLTQDPATELDTLFEQYAAPPEVPAEAATRVLRGREAIRHRLTSVFEQERVLAALTRRVRARDIAAASDDPFAFDFYYFKNGHAQTPDAQTHKFIQAVALDADSADIKSLSFTVQRLRTQLDRFQVTGVIDTTETAAADEEQTRTREFHQRVLSEAGIDLVPLTAAVELAAQIRTDLRLG